MRFWNHVLQKRNDVLEKDKNLGPYVKCIGKKWTLVKEMDWAKYLDDSMDEAINCSQFKSKTMVDKIKKRLNKLQTPIKESCCPINKGKLKNVILKYGKFAPIL